ncbi:MAG TPA: ADP-ribosylglycohydrolase family protein [Bacteroidales bacterium]|nr:ADP-ribosylglycohydrolase family protein [Bacteroidales bacterium]
MVKNVLTIAVLFLMFSCTSAQKENSVDSVKEITREELLNNLYGGWVGMLIGGLEGLPHEFKYDTLPAASLPDFVYLPHGARTDDDNDFELTHLYFMDKENIIKLPYPRIVDIWKANMNTGIWVANKRARDLMDQGIIPPATSDPENNTASSYNLSGQFCTESYGMIAPGMPQTAADIGIHYAYIAVSGEPIQATRYWTSLISLNVFHKGPVEEVIKEALKSVDPASAMAEVVTDAIDIYHENREDWKAGRQRFYKKWVIERNWNGNSTPSNGGMVLLSLLYGNRDFHKTLQYAMAMGLDADCNAATAGAVTGVNIGFNNIAVLPGFEMPDIYKNLTRPQLPVEMKISEQAELLMRICERVILDNGGEKISIKGKPGYRIKIQQLN